MTLEQSTSLIAAAVAAQDLEALQSAASKRALSIAMLPSLSPTSELRDAIEASIAAGEEAKRAIRAIRYHLRKDSLRVANIKHGFLGGQAPPTHQVDCKG